MPFIYQPLRQNYTPAAVLHVRAGGGAAALAAAVRREVQQLDPTLSVFNMRTLEDQVSDSLAPLRTNVIMLATSACWRWCWRRSASTAWPATRWRSARARLACAWRSARSPSTVLRLVLGRGLLLVAVGLVVGIAVAFVLTVDSAGTAGRTSACAIR